MANAAMSGGRDPRAFLRGLFDAAIAAAAPAETLARFLPPPPKGRTIVVGAGKAAASMAAALEAAWPRPARRARRHPLRPSARRREASKSSRPAIRCRTPRAQAAARAFSSASRGLSADDLVLCLISGGGSALLPLPAPGITLADKQAINRALLDERRGIAEMNCVRKHLSAIKGGRLAAAAAPARVVTPGRFPTCRATIRR